MVRVSICVNGKILTPSEEVEWLVENGNDDIFLTLELSQEMLNNEPDIITIEIPKFGLVKTVKVYPKKPE